MKTYLSKLLLTAAGVALTATASYGQERLDANVPFTFHTPNASLSAGKYAIRVIENGGTGVSSIENLATHNSIIGPVNEWISEMPGKARLVFRCRGTGCALAEVYDGRGNGWRFALPVRTSPEKERVAVVLVNRAAR